MLLLLFRLGDDRYAVDARQVVEVLPLVAVKQIPQAPAAVVGVFNYHGDSVPLIDLSQLALGRRSRPRLSTRIILVRHPDRCGRPQLLGLLAEQVTETMRCSASDFGESGVSVPAAPYLGPVTADGKGLVQWIEVDQLLPDDIRDLLFQAPEPA